MLKHTLHLIVPCLLAMVSVPARAGISIQYDHINTSDGLSSNRVLDILQDSQGFIWMASNNGLSRYDGRQFYNIEHPLSRTDSLTYADNRVKYLHEDENHLLWMMCVSGEICCYDLMQGHFLNIPVTDNHPNDYERYLYASHGHVWVMSDKHGVLRLSLTPNRTLAWKFYSAENGALPNNEIRFMLADSKENIWIGTKNGYAVIANPEAEYAKAKDSFVLDTAAYCEAGLACDTAVWILFRKGLVEAFSPTNLSKRLGTYKLGKTLENPPYQVSAHVRTGNKWLIMTRTAGYEFDFDEKTLVKSPLYDRVYARIIQDNCGSSYFYDNTGTLYSIADSLKTGPEIVAKDVFRSSTSIDKENYCVLRDLDSNLWVSTAVSGIVCYAKGDPIPTHYAPGTVQNHNMIESPNISCMYEDREGGIWIGATRAGVCRMMPNLKGASRWYVGDESDQGGVNAICYTGNCGDDILVGNRLGELLAYDQNFNLISKRELGANVYDVLYDKEGREWICTRGKGLVVDGVSYRKDASNPDALQSDDVFSAIQDNKGRIWVSTMRGGVALVDTSKQPYTFRTFMHSSTMRYNFKQIVQDNDEGWIWCATGNGLVVFHPDSIQRDSMSYRVYSLKNGNFCTNEMNCLWAGASGKVWVGTLGSGIVACSLTKPNRRLAYDVYDTSRGLISNEVANIYSDKKSGYLWIGTLGGMARFNIDNKSFDSFDFSQEALGNVYDPRDVAVLSDGRIVEGTYYGLTVIDPSKYTPSKQSRKPVISSLLVNGQEILLTDPDNISLTQSATYAKYVHLMPEQNSLSFTFFCTGTHQRRNFSYWLEGCDKSWSEPSPNPVAAYRNLSPGTYTLHVRACNDEGLWTMDANTSLRIEIESPWYRTWWAYGAYALVGIAILLFIIYIISERRRHSRYPYA